MSLASNATKAFAIAVIASTSVAVDAAQMGPTSSGSVSISITIPPRLQVAALKTGAQEPSAVCLSASGLGTRYHVVVVPEDGAPLQRWGPAQPSPSIACQGHGLESTRVPPSSAASPGRLANLSRPMMLLIVAD